jgi:hypothetical protein
MSVKYVVAISTLSAVTSFGCPAINASETKPKCRVSGLVNPEYVIQILYELAPNLPDEHQ